MAHNKKWSTSIYRYDKGLNCTDGGETGPIGKNGPKYALRGRPLSEETKKSFLKQERNYIKMGFRIPIKERNYLKKEKDRIGLSKIGKQYNLGTRWTQEQKDRLFAKKEKKAILQFDLEGI
jgi:hypothetical protein